MSFKNLWTAFFPVDTPAVQPPRLVEDTVKLVAAVESFALIQHQHPQLVEAGRLIEQKTKKQKEQERRSK